VGRLTNGGVYNDRYYYIPKTKPISGYNFTTPQQFNISSGSSINFTAEYLGDQNNPPDREIMYLKRDTDTAYQVGFAFGYSPFSITNRNCVSSNNGCWQISGVQKNYPVYFAGSGVVNNITYDVIGYRQWVDPSQNVGEKSMYWNNQDGHIVLYLDYHKNFESDTVRLPQPFVGKTVNILEIHNMTVEDSEVLPAGLHVSGQIDDLYSYAVLELTDPE
jgi:hypothetical protein